MKQQLLSACSLQLLSAGSGSFFLPADADSFCLQL
jgi:hypothetical protein